MGFLFKTAPWAHQLAELEDYWDAPGRALLWQMRTGKTKAVIDAAARLHAERGLRGMLVVAPNGVHENWVRKQLPAHCGVDFEAHAWSSKRVKSQAHRDSLRRVLATRGLAVLAVGKEALLSEPVQGAIKDMLKRGPTALVVDECHHFKTPGTKRTRLARGLAKRCAWRRILSGTATGNSPLGLFSQFELLSPGALGFTRFGDFEGRYAVIGEGYDPRSGRRYKSIEGYQNVEELQGRVAKWSSVVLREDCEDLPPLVTAREYYDPSGLQVSAYEGLRERYVAELQSGSLAEAADSGTRMLRLQQVLSNFVVNDAFEIETVDPAEDPRLDALEGLIDGPTVVWCRFRECIRRVAERLSRGHTVVQYHGGVRDEERIEALEAFQTGGADVLVANPACVGEGQDLSPSTNMVWYSHVFDVVQRDQASERATVMGGRSVAVTDLAAPGSVDEYILENLEGKRSVSERTTGRELRDILEGCRI